MSKDIRLNIKIRKKAMPIITELQEVMGCSPTEVLHQLIAIYGPRHIKLLKAQSESISLEETANNNVVAKPSPDRVSVTEKEQSMGITEDDFFLS